MSGVLGIAVASRKMSATAIGCVSSWAAVAASVAQLRLGRDDLFAEARGLALLRLTTMK